jgi:hypothetical protein
MKVKEGNIPVTMEAPGTIMRGISGYGGMTAAFNELPAGTDFTPVLQGLKNNSCPCPHWGYIVEGVLKMKYDNGKEETLVAGDVFYMPPGHTGIVEKDLKMIDFSPEKEMKEVMDHISMKMAQMVE